MDLGGEERARGRAEAVEIDVTSKKRGAHSGTAIGSHGQSRRRRNGVVFAASLLDFGAGVTRGDDQSVRAGFGVLADEVEIGISRDARTPRSGRVGGESERGKDTRVVVIVGVNQRRIGA